MKKNRTERKDKGKRKAWKRDEDTEEVQVIEVQVREEVKRQRRDEKRQR